MGRDREADAFSSNATKRSGDLPQVDASTESANFVSFLFWWWAGELLSRGYKTSLSLDDMWSLPKNTLVSQSAQKLEALWKNEIRKNKDPTLWSPLLSLAGPRFTVGVGLLYALWGAMTFVNVGYILPSLITWLRENSVGSDPSAAKTLPSWAGWVLAASMFVSTGVQQMFVHHYFFEATRLGLMVSSAVRACIYRKALRLSSVTTSVGEIVNLQSNDTSRIYDAMRYGHTIWLTPFVIIVNAGLLVQQVGWAAAIVGSVVCLLVIPVQTVIGRLIGSIKRVTLPVTDQRVRLMHEILSAIKLVKLYNWEMPFMKQTEDTREREMAGLRKVSVSKGLNNAWAMWSAPLVAFVTFSICSAVEPAGKFNATSAFTALALFNILRFPMSVLPSAVKSVAEARVAVRRLTNFFLMDELEDKRILLPHGVRSKYSAIVTDASFNYPFAGSERGLNDSRAEYRSKSERNDVELDQKTFSLKRIDLKIRRGECIAVVGRVGSGKSTLLLSLAGQLQQSKGSTKLYGSVAYVSQTAWLLNDSLKQNILFGQEYHSDRYTSALQSCQLMPDLEQLPAGDDTEIGERGINLSGGQKARVSLARAVFSDRDIYLLDDPLSAVDQHVGNRLFKKCIRGSLRDKTVVFVTNQLQYLSKCDRVVVLDAGSVAQIGTYEQLIRVHGPLSDMVKDQVSSSKKDDNMEDNDSVSERKKERKSRAVPQNASAKLIVAEDRATGNVGAAVYAHYFKSGGWVLCIWVIALNLLQQTVRAMSDWWVSYWAKDQTRANPFQFYVWVYSIFLVGYGLFLLIRSFSYAVFTMRASTNLHNGVFSRVLRAPMAFFDSTPLGRILNRFTKDQDNIDDMLPDAFEQATQSLLTVVSGVIVIISVLWWFALALIPIGAAFWFLGVYYRRTSREIKRLDGITRSPIFAHLSSTLNGLSTLRAYGAQRSFELQNRLKIDVNTSMQYHFEVAARWLAVRLDFLSIIIVSGTALLTVAMKDVVPSALSALALSYALQTTGMMQWGVRMLAETENQMTSVERLMSYTRSLDQEAAAVVDDRRPPEGWPQRPTIRFRKVELRYKPDLPPVLKRVSFKINAREKIGIAGRTGAGKSTLAISLFRILEPSHGQILIDGLDVLKIGLDDLRSKLAIIPQDPVLFKNSVRYNIDPFALYSDAELWDTLEKVFLKDFISSMPGQLDAPVQENGSNFSAGQRQLICFARAVLRKSKILVLDEATASIDSETDERIQRTIRETFRECTVLTIAHRLHTIIDSDRIMLLDRGEILEFAPPAVLLRNPDSAFSKLVDETGVETARYLRDVAEGKVPFFSLAKKPKASQKRKSKTTIHS